MVSRIGFTIAVITAETDKRFVISVRYDIMIQNISTQAAHTKTRDSIIKLYDISQEVFSCAVFPGDPDPEKKILSSIASGALYNLTAFSMCAHNDTHVDTPFHFLGDGKTAEQLGLEIFVGNCFVARHTGNVSAAAAQAILTKANGTERILLADNVTVMADAAMVFAESGICLLGNEGQTIGPATAPMQAHLILLRRSITLLGGIVLTDVPEGHYFLSAAPLNLAGSDGSPAGHIPLKRSKYNDGNQSVVSSPLARVRC